MRRLPRLVPALLPLVLSFPASLRAQARPDVADPLATYAGRPIVSLSVTLEGARTTDAAVLDQRYWMPDGGYAFTADDTPDVIVRMRSAHDDATPNANALMISNLVALHLLTGKPAWLERAQAIPRAFAADLARNTFGHCGLIAGTLDVIAPQQVVVIEPQAVDAVPGSSPLARAMLDLSLPGAVEQIAEPGRTLANPALTGKSAIDGKATAYACLGPQCSLPVTDPEALVDLLRKQRMV